MDAGQSLRIKGDIIAAEDVTITGRVEGHIDASGFAVRVAAGSNVVGNVAAASVLIDGRVQGEIVASDCVHVGALGTVEGNLHTARLAIADGGCVQGRVDMSARQAELHAVAS